MDAFEVIPQVLRERDQWVVWKLTESGGRGKATKVPYSARSRLKASVTDRTSLSSFELACEAFQGGGFDGVGFVLLDDDPFVGVDLDGVRDPDSDAITPEAAAIVEQLDSYTEVSQSGTGLHIIAKASKPGPKARKGPLEIYETGRYLVMTGDILADSRETVEARQEQIDALYRETFGVVRQQGSADVTTDDVRLSAGAEPPYDKLARLLEGKRFTDTWNHSRKDLDSTSQYDLALANLAVGDGWKDQEIANLVIRFRKRHEEKPEKALRPDYIRGLLEKARDRSGVLDALPFQLARVIKLGASDSVYEFEIEENGVRRRVEVGPADALMSFRRASTKLYDAGYLLPNSLKKTWPKLLEAFQTITVEEETLSDHEAWTDFVHEWIARQPVATIGEDVESLGEAFALYAHACADGKGRVYLRLEGLAQQAAHLMGQGLTRKAVARKLRQLGFEKVERIEVGGPKGDRRRINLWMSPADFAPHTIREGSHEDAA